MARKSKQDFLRDFVSERLAGNAACGIGDPYPHDVAAKVALEAFYALGGTEDEARLALKEGLASELGAAGLTSATA